MRIDQSTIGEILRRTDLGSFIGNYVSLRKRGNDLVGLCPFHSEKTPSLHVHPDKGYFKCFGCGAGGDAIKFLQLLEGLTFPDATRALAKRAGVEIEEETPETARWRSEKEAIYAANDLAAAFFHRMLKLAPDAEGARAYCKARGIEPATIDAFRLGFAPDSWDSLVRELTQSGFDLELAAKAGLVKAGQRGCYDFYRARLMIPTHSTTGEVVAFGGRTLDGSEPKYLNTSTTPVYVKGRGLFALERARRAAAEKDTLIVVEGYLDCIALHQAGFTNAVASLGTAFTPEQAAELRKYAQRIFVCFDADAAGTAATTKSIDVLTAVGCIPYIVELPPGQDPDTYIRTHGTPGFEARLESALPWIQFKLDREVDRIVAKRLPPAHAARQAEALVRGLSPEEWDRWRVYAANRLGLNPNDLRNSRFVANPANFAPRAGAQFSRYVAPAAEPRGIERDILETLLDEPALVAEYASQIDPAVFKDARYAPVYQALVENADSLASTTDALATLAGDPRMRETAVALLGSERSSKVRFPDSAARRLHLDRVVEHIAEAELERRKRELEERADRLFEAGQPVSAGEREELQRLVEQYDHSKRKRLGTK